MVAGHDAHTRHHVAFVIDVPLLQPGPIGERIRPGVGRLAIIRREPHDMLHPANPQRLLEIENQEAAHRADLFDLAIRLRHHADVGDAGEPFPDAFPTGGDLVVGLLQQVFSRDAKERGLHRSGGDFERLDEEGADGHGDGERHEQHLHIFTPGRMRIRLERLIGGGFEPAHFRF